MSGECSIIETMIRIANETVAPSQTLDRGLACLDFVAAADHAVSVDVTAEALGLHRSIVYRLLRTLELRRLVERDPDGDFLPGPYLAVLSRSVRRSLRAAAAPVVVNLAEELQMTAFVVVADGDDAVTVDSVEPRSLNAHVAYRPGTRHAIDRGAPGLALLAARPSEQGERAEVALARRRGWALSEAEVLAGMASVASPIGDQGAVAVLWLAGASDVDTEVVGRRVVEAARQIESRL
jgi:DNA-binding IclR family transcriptional regulator